MYGFPVAGIYGYFIGGFDSPPDLVFKQDTCSGVADNDIIAWFDLFYDVEHLSGIGDFVWEECFCVLDGCAAGNIGYQ
jgi:hypothetical protein